MEELGFINLDEFLGDDTINTEELVNELLSDNGVNPKTNSIELNDSSSDDGFSSGMSSITPYSSPPQVRRTNEWFLSLGNDSRF